MQYVFSTSKTKRYHFPTHSAELVVDRSEAHASEVFVVILEPGQVSPLHKHDDTEQVFCIIEGKGLLTTGEEKREHHVKVGDIVRIPPLTLHSIEAEGDEVLRYLAIDCFGSKGEQKEPTWDEHIKVFCREQGWDFEKVTD